MVIFVIFGLEDWVLFCSFIILEIIELVFEVVICRLNDLLLFSVLVNMWFFVVLIMGKDLFVNIDLLIWIWLLMILLFVGMCLLGKICI